MKYVNPRLFRDGLSDINYSTVGWILLGNPVVKNNEDNWIDYYKNNDVLSDPQNTRLKVILDSELEPEDDMTSESTTDVTKYFFYDANILGISCALEKIKISDNNYDDHKSFASIKHSINNITEGSATKTYFKNEINIDIPFNGNEEEATKILPFYKYTEIEQGQFDWVEIPNENYPNNFGFDLKEPGGFLALVKYKDNDNLPKEDITLNNITYKGYKPETIMNYRFSDDIATNKALSDIYTFDNNSISFDDTLIYKTNQSGLSRRFYDYFIDDILAYYTVQNTDLPCINKASYKGFATGKLVIPVTGEAS